MTIGPALGWITDGPWSLVVTGAGFCVILVQFVRWMLFASKGIDVAALRTGRRLRAVAEPVTMTRKARTAQSIP